MDNENSKKRNIDTKKQEIKRPLKNSRNESWHKHPIILIIISFVFSTLLGNIITHQLAIQQEEHLKKEKRLEKKVQLITEFSNGLSEYLSMITHLIHVYYVFHEHSMEGDSNEFTELRKAHSYAYGKWQALESNTKTEINIYFDKNTEANRLMQDIKLLCDSRSSKDSSIYLVALNLLLKDRKDLKKERSEIGKLTAKLGQNKKNAQLKLDSVKLILSSNIIQ